MRRVAFALLLLATALVGVGEASETRVVVRAKSKDAKFIGTSMGGAQVTIRRSDDGRVLAQGLTQGGTGDTKRLMVEPLQRGHPLADTSAAKFEASIDIDEPTLVTIEARAPSAQSQSRITSTTEIWLIPGKHVLGDGVILEIPGLAVDVDPPTPEEVSLTDQKAVIPITVNVVMMCGCPIEPDGLWDASEYEVAALVTHESTPPLQTIPLTYAGRRNTFTGSLEVTKKGRYELLVYAFHPATGNSGVDHATVTVK